MSKKEEAIEFCTIWETSADVEEVSLRSGMSVKAAIARAYRYRQLGVNLKYFGTPNAGVSKKLDVDAMNKAISKVKRDG